MGQHRDPVRKGKALTSLWGRGLQLRGAETEPLHHVEPLHTLL